MDFKQVSKKYRPIPFWSWNEKLDPEETREQIKMMDEAGIGGFFMHARGGLQTPYMEEEWFENVTASVEEAEARGMYAWAYDENGWPSGFGDGKVNGLGIEYQQKYLRMSEEEPSEHVIGKNGNHWFYFEVNPFYVDTLDKKVIRKFIETSYVPYYEKYGKRIEGFFTDEPQISRNGIPWSFVYEEEYKARYGENILEHLEELFLPVADYKQTRVKFWKMVTDLFSSAFMKQIYDQCEEWGLKFTGHLVLEETLESQLVSNGACMPHYEYFHIPGMDWLGRELRDVLTVKQLGSVAEQLGKEQVLTETFGCSGHNVSFAEMKGNMEWQMVRGVSLLCTHLSGYSIRGIRKRDYPPALFYQQPWWCEYEKFITAMSREGMILSQGKREVDVLLLHPQSTAWTLYDDKENAGLSELNDKLLGIMKLLDEKHIQFHFGDETIMERHGRVEEGKLVIGKQAYSCVIDPGCEVLLENTEKLLAEFTAAGGKMVSAEELLVNDIVDRADITYTKRIYDDFNVHYFVNTSAERKTANVKVAGKILDIYTGELLPFDGTHEFEPWGSLMVIEEGSGFAASSELTEDIITLDQEMNICGNFVNCMTLDRCDYYFDGELQEENGFVLNIAERANALERAIKLHQDYYVKIDEVPSSLYLVCETPEKFEIKINGKVVEQKIEGWVIDKSFKKIDIAAYMQEGENVISFDCEFVQSDVFYANLRKAHVFESEKNKLSYDMEIEPIYLMGDFGVKTEGEWIQLGRNAMRYIGEFVIGKAPTKIHVKHMEQQGIPFFCGTLSLCGEIDIQGENPVLLLGTLAWNVVKVEINGIEKTLLTEKKLNLSEFGVSGKTEVIFTLTNNLRNLMGPHHLKIGEAIGVGPHRFVKESCVWNKNPEPSWDDDYCFVMMEI